MVETLIVPKIQGEPPHAADWRKMARTALERLPIPFRNTAVLVVLLLVVEQLLEELVIPSPASLETWRRMVIRIALPTLALYILLTMRLLKREVVDCLCQIRGSVKIDDERFESLVRQMIRPSPGMELGLLVISSAVVLLLFTVLGTPLPIHTSTPLPDNPLLAGYILLSYILIGWLGLSMVYAGIQHAIYLGKLARQPLNINVFDPENLLPFGSISLLHSLVLVGIVVILRVMLGRPTSPASYLVITLASLGSLMALVLPLLGVFRQMRVAKFQALNNINHQLMRIQQAIMADDGIFEEDATDLNASTNALVNLRRTILESPNWPFRSTSAVIRAMLAATSPLIYFVLIELVRAYILPALTG